jgi:hypothetical protein
MLIVRDDGTPGNVLTRKAPPSHLLPAERLHSLRNRYHLPPAAPFRPAAGHGTLGRGHWAGVQSEGE